MAKYEEAAKLLREGVGLQEIADRLHLSFRQLTTHLYAAVGRNLITRTDILFSFDEPAVCTIEALIEQNNPKNRWELQQALRSDFQGEVSDDAVDEALLYFDLRDAACVDMYEMLSRIERFLHRYIKTTLSAGLNPSESFWSELPLNVRKECACRREEDEDPQDDPYLYTRFVHLKVMFEKYWAKLSRNLPGSVAADKPAFLSSLQRLNRIRNRVMHPVHRYRPTLADFEDVRDFTFAMFGEAELEAANAD